MCSDHFSPWFPEQGQSGFAWSWLGAALEGTNLSFGTVRAPGDRYHPAVVAQAAATLSVMYPGGCGRQRRGTERAHHRREVAEEAGAERAAQGVHRHHAGALEGRDRLPRRSRTRSCTAAPPLLLGAALSEETARFVGGWADGLITVAGKPDAMRRMVATFRDGGGEGKPLFLQVALSYAKSEDEAADAAHREWRQAGLEATQLADLRTPAEFHAAAPCVTKEKVRETLRVSSDLARHADWLRADVELGFDALYLHNVGRNQDEFIDTFAARVLPTLR